MELLLIPVEYKKGLSKKFMDSIISSLSTFDSIGLFSTVQFLKQMKQMKMYLESKGKHVLLGKPSGHSAEEGQVLGCDSTSPISVEKEVDAFLFIGTGYFHPANLSLHTEKQIIQADPVSEKVYPVQKEKVRTYATHVAKARKVFEHSKKVGILVSAKPGQNAMKVAHAVKKSIEKIGKYCQIFLFDTISPDELYNFPQIDIWVNTACPRIAIDDFSNYPKVIINLSDLKF